MPNIKFIRTKFSNGWITAKHIATGFRVRRQSDDSMSCERNHLEAAKKLQTRLGWDGPEYAAMRWDNESCEDGGYIFALIPEAKPEK